MAMNRMRSVAAAADCAASAGAVGTATARSLARSLALEAGLVASGVAALALIGQISIPLPFTPVPVTLGTLAALGVGSVLGSRRALVSAAVLAVAAVAGAPVLAGWTGGVTPAFGYVMGYALVGMIAGRARPLVGSADGLPARLAGRVGVMLAASAAVYLPGLIWLHVATGASWSATISLGLVPFIIGDVLKSVVAALLPGRAPAPRLR